MKRLMLAVALCSLAGTALAAPKPCDELKADSIDTHAEVTLDQVDGGFAITAVNLILKAKIPGASQQQFEELSNKAKEGCPVSKVLNARITLDATLLN
jgi:osmotically inducible protein OsmC